MIAEIEQKSSTNTQTFSYEELSDATRIVAFRWASEDIIDAIDLNEEASETIFSDIEHYGIDVDAQKTRWSIGDRGEFVAIAGSLNIEKIFADESDIYQDDVTKSTEWKNAITALKTFRDIDLTVHFTTSHRSSSWTTTETEVRDDLMYIDFSDVENIPKNFSARTIIAYQSTDLQKIFEDFIRKINDKLVKTANAVYNQVYEKDYIIEWLSSNDERFFICGHRDDQSDDHCEKNGCQADES